jgi:hypothetical protein
MAEDTDVANVPAGDVRPLREVRQSVDALRATSKDLVESSRLLIAESRRLTARWPHITGL